MHRIPTLHSTDLVHWTYVGDAFSEAPAWMERGAPQWAPDVRYLGGRYVMFYTATNTTEAVSGEPDCDGDSAIGAATAPTPTGPWTDSGHPVVAPRRGGPGCNFLWTFDPAVTTEPGGKAHLYYGSYYGGVQVRDLDLGALATDAASAKQVVIPNRYEGAFVVRRGGWYYLMGSATDCCRGPLTGYSVFAGRSRSPEGPFVDRLGVPLTASRVGGTPVISMNGNRWVGPGHNSVVTDEAGQDWFAYHAIDQGDPYLAAPNPLNINQRPLLLDRLEWVRGWPSVRAGRWASDTPQPAPVTREGGRPRPPRPPVRNDRPGRRLRAPSDEFNRRHLERGWRWVRSPAATLVRSRGTLRFPVQDADISGSPATRVPSRSPPCSCATCRGAICWWRRSSPSTCRPTSRRTSSRPASRSTRDDDAFVKLAHVAIFETRQTEWAKEVPTPVTPRRAALRLHGHRPTRPHHLAADRPARRPLHGLLEHRGAALGARRDMDAQPPRSAACAVRHGRPRRPRGGVRLRPRVPAAMTEEGYFGERVAAGYDQDSAGMFDPEVVAPAVDMLAELAGEGAALEFAIGTGRIALPLAERGVRVVGIDNSEAMLARLREKPGADRLEAMVGDMASTRAEGEFAVVYLVFNTIFNLITQDGQVACFANAAAHLGRGGRFVIEARVPELQRLPLGQTVLPWRADPRDDLLRLRPATQRLSGQHYSFRRRGSSPARSRCATRGPPSWT